MNTQQQLLYLIKYMIHENPSLKNTPIPDDIAQQQQLLRGLSNIRPPHPVSAEFLEIQDSYLKTILAEKNIISTADLSPIQKNIYLWQGDITTLAVDAIVNAANNKLLGCFIPSHRCIDNAIHTFAGVQLRLACNQIMTNQSYDEPTGTAKITSGFNLPAKHVIHTVGPIVSSPLNSTHKKLLENCYTSCLNLAKQNNLQSIAFCCISTGEFSFPNQPAGEIAVKTVTHFLKNNPEMEVIFNVFKDTDKQIYQQLLG